LYSLNSRFCCTTAMTGVSVMAILRAKCSANVIESGAIRKR
jgi:hypothetical protein